MDKEGNYFICGILLGMFVMGAIFMLSMNGSRCFTEKELVRSGYAHYSTETGIFILDLDIKEEKK